MSPVIQLSDNLIAASVTGPAGIGPLTAYTDGRRFYFTDEEISVIAAELTGLRDSVGRRVSITQGAMGWQECHGSSPAVPLHRLHVEGRSAYRLDDEWQFRPVSAVPVSAVPVSAVPVSAVPVSAVPVSATQ